MTQFPMNTDLSQVPYFVSWSGGKDSCLALSKVVPHLNRPSFLLTMMTEQEERSRSHGLLKAVLQAQAHALNVPILLHSATWDNYEKTYVEALKEMREKGIKAGVFGDMNLQEDGPNNRQWVDHVCKQGGMIALEPLWERSLEELIADFSVSSIKAQIIAVRDDCLDRKYLGQILTPDLMEEFIKQNIHPLGEKGEYHTVVVDCPLFSYELNLIPGAQVLKDGVWFLDVTLLSK